jgi:anti-anti-sigma factor
MNVRRRKGSPADFIEITGPFDFSRGAVIAIAGQMLDEGARIIAIDLSKAIYMTSAGVAAILKILKKTRSMQGTLEIHGATPDMMKFLANAGIEKHVKNHTDISS